MEYLESDLNIVPKQSNLKPIMNNVNEVSSFLTRSFAEGRAFNHKPLIIAFDGYVGADWSIVFRLKEELENMVFQLI